jgi:ribosomal protein S27E
MKKLPVYEMLIDESDESDLQVDFIALVDKPAIKKDFMKFAEDMPHYTAEGVLWVGPTHKDANGRLMTGAVHSEDSVYLYHNKQEMIVCKECGHTWEYAEGGENPYKCHMCNYAFISYSDYPDAVKNNAKAALDYANENGWGSCGTEVGKQRANQLAKGEPISFDTIKRMYSYLSRHEVDLDSSKVYGDGCGKLMYDAWGGKSALSWAESKIKQVERKGFAIQDEDQRIISGPLMVANQKIPRVDADGFEYEVFFSPATIKKIAIKMAKKGFQNNVNLMHSANMQLSGVTLFEIFQSDKERGIMPMKGFEDLSDGSLFGSMYVDNDQAWQLIKDGKVKGFSVEGNFGMKGKDKYDEQMEQIISILSETNFE